MQSAEIGFDPENLFSVQLSMPRSKYQTPTSREVFAEQLLERLRSSPGVTVATQVFSVPPNALTFIGSGGFEIRGAALSEADAQASRVVHFIWSDYFSALRIALVEGRTFTADEMRSKTAVIVNRAAAEHFWPDGGALGGEIKWQQDWTTVVGVVDNVLFGSLTRGRDTPQFYWPLPMGPGFGGGPSPLTFVVRGTEVAPGAGLLPVTCGAVVSGAWPPESITSWGGFAPSREEKETLSVLAEVSAKEMAPLPLTADVTSYSSHVPLIAAPPDASGLPAIGGAFAQVIPVSVHELETPYTVPASSDASVTTVQFALGFQAAARAAAAASSSGVIRAAAMLRISINAFSLSGRGVWPAAIENQTYAC